MNSMYMYSDVYCKIYTHDSAVAQRLPHVPVECRQLAGTVAREQFDSFVLFYISVFFSFCLFFKNFFSLNLFQRRLEFSSKL